MQDEIKEAFYENRLNVSDIAKELYKCEKNNFIRYFIYLQDFGPLLDIISAVFKGNIIEFKDGSKITLKIGHSSDYFTFDSGISCREIFANFNSLIVQNREGFLDDIKVFFWNRIL